MARAFSDADIIQADTGTATGTAINATLPTGVTAGRTGIIVFASYTVVDSPEQWHIAAGGASSAAAEKNPRAAICCRADLPAGETAWNFPLQSGTAVVAWRVEEWANISYAPLVAKHNVHQILSPTTVNFSAAMIGDLTPAYNVAYAAVSLMGSVATSAWGADGTWSDGFTEINKLQVGPGNDNGSLQLRIARKFGGLNETGPWVTSYTYGGAETNKTAYGALAVFRAEHHEGDI